MKSVLYTTSKSTGFDASNPMAIQLRKAMADQYGFVPSDDPITFKRQLIVARAKAIEAEAVVTNKDKPAAMTEVKAESTAQTAAPAAAPAKPRAKFVTLTIGVKAAKQPAESTKNAIKRLDSIVQSAEEREMRRQYGRFGRVQAVPEAPESDFTAIRRQHAEVFEDKVSEREQLIEELQSLNAFSGEFMLDYDVFELRRALRKAKKIRGLVDKSASIAIATEPKPISFEGFSVSESERDRIVYVIRNLRGQLPMDWESCSLYELLNHLRNLCMIRGRQWMSELWPAAEPARVAVVAAPAVAKQPVQPATPVDASVERLWKAIFGSEGAGF